MKGLQNRSTHPKNPGIQLFYEVEIYVKDASWPVLMNGN